MPLGKLSKVQIAKGFEVCLLSLVQCIIDDVHFRTSPSSCLIQALEQLEEALKKGASRTALMELSSKFYTIIPHDFGRQIPPVIDSAEHLQKKFDMLTVRACQLCLSLKVTGLLCSSYRFWETLRSLSLFRRAQTRNRPW